MYRAHCSAATTQYGVRVCVYVRACARTVQEQCCAGALRESRCLTGMYAARAGEMCEVNTSPHCGEDTQKVLTHTHALTLPTKSSFLAF